MSRKIAYRVCQVQDSRVTFVDGQWIGKVSPTKDHMGDAIQSCPMVWDYLKTVGGDGWELASAVASASGASTYQVLYLKRES